MDNIALRDLHASLDRRIRPEDVADRIAAVLDGQLSDQERAILETAARASYRRRGYASSMTDDFARPDDGARQLAAVARLFGNQEWVAADPADTSALTGAATAAGRGIGWEVTGQDFKSDRLDRVARHAAGIDVSKRQYNRRFRALGRLASKASRLDEAAELRRLLLIGRSGFAATLDWERFSADVNAACFVAYFAARRNLRRQFSLSGKDNPFDSIADMLMKRCETNPATDWAMISAPNASNTSGTCDRSTGSRWWSAAATTPPPGIPSRRPSTLPARVGSHACSRWTRSTCLTLPVRAR